MKNVLLLLALVVLSPADFSYAADCSYCSKLAQLKAEFSKVKPDPMNEKTIQKQNDLLDETEELIKEITAKKVTEKDIQRIVEILAAAVPFDYSESLGQSLESTFKPFSDRLDNEVRRQQKAKILSKAQAEQILISLAMGEDINEHGTDNRAD